MKTVILWYLILVEVLGWFVYLKADSNIEDHPSYYNNDMWRMVRDVALVEAIGVLFILVVYLVSKMVMV